MILHAANGLQTHTHTMYLATSDEGSTYNSPLLERPLIHHNQVLLHKKLEGFHGPEPSRLSLGSLL